MLTNENQGISITEFGQIRNNHATCCCTCECAEEEERVCSTHITNVVDIKRKAEKGVNKIAEKILDKQEKADQKRKLEDRIEKKIKSDQKKYDDKEHEELMDKVNKQKNKIIDKQQED